MALMRLYGLLVIALIYPFSAWSAGPAPESDALFGSPLPDSELAQLRGGFFQNGLEISIGLEQIVSVNGEQMIVNRLTIPNLNQKVAGQAIDHSMETVLQVMQPDQAGGTRVSTELAGHSGWVTVIQNSLNSTVIQNIHQLNIELNNLATINRVPSDLSKHLDSLLSR